MVKVKNLDHIISSISPDDVVEIFWGTKIYRA